MRTTALAVAALLATGVAAKAETTAERFSYPTPSGMFGDGYFKWNMYRFFHEDAERTAKFNAGRAEATGSLETPTSNEEAGPRSPVRRRAR